MLPETGKRFPIMGGRPSERDYVICMSEALRAELGTTHAAAKTIMRWTGASDHTARNWLNGQVGPSGYHAICLARESPAALATILELAGRADLMLALDIHATEVAVAKLSGALEILKRQRIERSRYAKR